MRIDVVNDLHITNANEIAALLDRGNHTDTLVVSGDVSQNEEITAEYLRRAAQRYSRVFFVDGNHEHRSPIFENITDTSVFYSTLADGIDNLTYFDGLSESYSIIGGVAFVGCNGWYDWRGFSDKGCSFIKALGSWEDNSDDVNIDFESYFFPSNLGSEHVAILKTTVEELNNRPDVNSIVILTHSAPLVESFDEDMDESLYAMSASYMNSEYKEIIDSPISSKLVLWAYGHTHTRKDFIRNGVRYINNFYGYPWERKADWRPTSVRVDSL